MIFRIVTIICILVCCSAAAPEARAGNGAFELLVKMFQDKGVLTPGEARMLQKAMAAERRALAEKERSLEKREQALKQKEAALAEKKSTPMVQRAAKAPGSDKTAAKLGYTPIPLNVSYYDGVRFTAEDPDLFTLKLGGLLQFDYRNFNYQNQDPAKNGFDLRRVRLALAGKVFKHFSYKFEYEFQGAGSRRLLDAYVDGAARPWLSVRLGQYKTPFSLDQSTKDSNLVFAERAMGYYLSPGRDLGVMVHGSAWEDRVIYGAGVFSGDGPDDATGADSDELAFIGRLVLAPFKAGGPAWIRNLQFGGSYEHQSIDKANIKVAAYTTGLTQFMDISTNAKFSIVQKAGDLTRTGLEAAWAWGPVAFASEYTEVKFTGVETSKEKFDFGVKDFYIAGLWMITGEEPTLSRGIWQPIRPRRSIFKKGWGGLGLALRYDRFEAGEEVYQYLVDPGDSAREAEAWSFALNWFLSPAARLIFDYTHTEFDEPLLIGRDSISGTTFTSDYEDVFTARFQLGF